MLFLVANANADIENLEEELRKKNEESQKQQEEIKALSYDMREVHRRLTELKKENEELKLLLSLTGKTPLDYETKVIRLLSSLFLNHISEI